MSLRDEYTKNNAAVWEKWSKEDYEWTRPIGQDVYSKALTGEWQVILTPMKPVPAAWFPPLQGAAVLGLASGGGQQMPIFASQGADVTLLDICDTQLEADRMVAQREGYDITIVKGDMTKRLPFQDGSFDLIFHPVSNSYVHDVEHVWRECHRVLKNGGVLMAGFANPILYLFDDDEEGKPLVVKNKLPYDPLKDCTDEELEAMAPGAIQFSHSLETQLGGQLKAGLVLTHLFEDDHHEGELAKYLPTFIATRAIKP